MSYKKILETLKNLPEDQRLLAATVYIYRNDDGKEECGCVLGKGLPHLREVFLEENNQGIDDIWNVEATQLDGMLFSEAMAAQKQNDHFKWQKSAKNSLGSRHARYIYMVNWLEKQVAAEEEA